MKNASLFVLALLITVTAPAQSIILPKASPSSTLLISDRSVSAIYTDASDDILIQKAASFLQEDIERVTLQKPGIVNSLPSAAKNIIIIGSLNGSPLIQRLVKEKKINTTSISGKWEAYQIQTIRNPIKGIESALIITGSDKRGTAYGVFEISKQMGVSPWYWWADVPVKGKTSLYTSNNTIIIDSPRVKYRGIFINDEAPAFSGWTKEKFGGVNHLVYEKIFELILRLKGNYLWPAMWGNAFNDDDTLNPVLADQYGIVMGTSHHEPMLRAQQEWKRYGKGKWDYDSNEVVLKEFWKKGIQNMGTHESIVTIGMRGDGDKPMTEGTATALLERIVNDQRKILEDVTHKPASKTPQLWALYKEVQDYYDKGMRVPDDVTLLLCDDNWGNIRKLPRVTDKPRTGGYGIYYHFDYVGGPRNYKWVNTNPIPRVWEQMHLAYEYGVKNIWIVNVGDIKPMEFPISFFLDYAWNPNKIGPTDIQKYTQQWSAAQFGDKYSADITDILSKYAKYNGRRKPELLDANTYELANYREFPKAVEEYADLLGKAEKIGRQLDASYRAAYFELVLHPVKACANLYEMYYNVALNKETAPLKLSIANEFAEKVKQCYIKDSLISIEYNTIAEGKWNHMMDQTHIGYTYWQQPPVNKMPAVQWVPIDPTVAATDITTNFSTPLIPAYVSIAADHFSRAINTNGIYWQVIPDLGRTGSAITPFPVTAKEQTPGGNGPCLQYDITITTPANLKINAYFSPTLNFHNDEGLKYGISVGNEKPQIIAINKEDNDVQTWGKWVANNIIIKTTSHPILRQGKYTVKFWMVSSGVVLQKLVIDLGGLKSSYLGPPETK